MDAEAWINAVFDHLAKEIVSHDKVGIRGVGTFATVLRKEREYIDANTKERMVSPEHWSVSYTPSTTIISDLKEYKAHNA